MNAAVELTNVTKTFGPQVAVDDLSLAVGEPRVYQLPQFGKDCTPKLLDLRRPLWFDPKEVARDADKVVRVERKFPKVHVITRHPSTTLPYTHFARQWLVDTPPPDVAERLEPQAKIPYFGVCHPQSAGEVPVGNWLIVRDEDLNQSGLLCGGHPPKPTPAGRASRRPDLGTRPNFALVPRTCESSA